MEDLVSERGVTADWHLEQSQRLRRIALEKGSSTALVYAALEARNAIERLVFEMSVLATGGSLTDEQLRTAEKQHGVYRLLEEAMENYRKHIEFQNMCLDASGLPVRFPVPDIRRCKRLTTELSSYCHCQLDPDTTVRDRAGDWFVRGLALVQKTCEFLRPLLDSPRGVLRRETMPQEVREMFDSYLSGTLDAASVRTRLDIMQPVLERRLGQQTV